LFFLFYLSLVKNIVHQYIYKKVGDVIPSGVEEKDRPGSVCERSEGTFYCVRDAHLVFRRVGSKYASG
jgi:hypothetical protein